MKTQKLRLDWIFINNFCHKIKSFSKQNSLLRIYLKPTEFAHNRTEIEKNFQCEVVIQGLLIKYIFLITRSKIWGGEGNFLLCPIGRSDGSDALDTKWADFDVEKVNELLE